MPPAVPDASRAAVLAGLRIKIEAGLEVRNPAVHSDRDPGPGLGEKPHAPTWVFGEPEIDAWLGADGLARDGVHEVKGACVRDWPATLAFALRLALRRSLVASLPRPPLLWCWPSALASELGRPHGCGLAGMGLDPSSLLVAETARATDALWAIEEGLKSESLALVIGVLPSLDLTPARRLSLAAKAHRTPCLLLTHPQSSPTAATATRWLLARRPSAPHPFDPRAPGASRISLTLERCRASPLMPGREPLVLEWRDEEICFRVAPVLAVGAAGPRRAFIRAR